jgi:hypothetical protein
MCKKKLESLHQVTRALFHNKINLDTHISYDKLVLSPQSLKKLNFA